MNRNEVPSFRATFSICLLAALRTFSLASVELAQSGRHLFIKKADSQNLEGGDRLQQAVVFPFAGSEPAVYRLAIRLYCWHTFREDPSQTDPSQTDPSQTDPSQTDPVNRIQSNKSLSPRNETIRFDANASYRKRRVVIRTNFKTRAKIKGLKISWCKLALMTFVVAMLMSRFENRQGAGDDLTRRIDRWIEQLSHPSFAVREEATSQLSLKGLIAIKQLRIAAASSDPELAWRANSILEKVVDQRDVDGLQGTWRYDEVTRNGKPEPGKFGSTFVVKGQSLWIIRKDGVDEFGEMPFSVHPEKRPCEFEFEYQGTVIKGVYRLENETVTLCYPSISNGPRPTKFSSDPGEKTGLYVLSRVN